MCNLGTAGAVCSPYTVNDTPTNCLVCQVEQGCVANDSVCGGNSTCNASSGQCI